MNFQTEAVCVEPKLVVENYLPKMGKEAVVEGICQGLFSESKKISSMFFYDAVGSKLFEKITRLPEYYPTRTEIPLIKEMSDKNKIFFEDLDIVEIGSGDCTKISLVLDAIPKAKRDTVRYIPIDVSQSAIEESANKLSCRYPDLSIHCVVADFLSQLEHIPKGPKRLFCFFGSTIGNFTRQEATRFFNRISKAMQPGDRLMLGMDNVKKKEVLERAYNDSLNVTAAFNKNSLSVINNLIKSDFDLAKFDHLAFYNETEARIEMHLKARQDMIVRSPCFKMPLIIKKAETIHTENSHKFKEHHIQDLEQSSGLKTEHILNDENKWFSLVQFIKPIAGYYAGN